MATLDRYVEAMSKQRGDGLIFKPGVAPELVSGGAARPIASRAITQEQIQMLLGEVLGPDVLTKTAGSTGTFAYQSPFGPVTISIVRGPQGLLVRVQPGGDAPAAPQPAARPASVEAPRATGGDGPAPRNIDELFHQMLDLKASDLHLKSGKLPMVRVDGSMMPLPGRPPLERRTLDGARARDHAGAEPGGVRRDERHRLRLRAGRAARACAATSSGTSPASAPCSARSRPRS